MLIRDSPAVAVAVADDSIQQWNQRFHCLLQIGENRAAKLAKCSSMAATVANVAR